MQFWLQESDTAETMHSKINFEVTVFLPESALFIILFCITELAALAGVGEHLYLRKKYMTFQAAFSDRLRKINLLLIHDGDNDRSGK
jgi:hypothetical protein